MGFIKFVYALKQEGSIAQKKMDFFSSANNGKQIVTINLELI